MTPPNRRCPTTASTFNDATRIVRRLNWWCDSLFIYSIKEYGLLGRSMSHKYRHRILQNNGRTQHQNPMPLRTLTTRMRHEVSIDECCGVTW